jgi:thymidylate kinase
LRNESFVIEVLGPSGAGKSTLVQALGSYSSEIIADFCLIPGSFGYSSIRSIARKNVRLGSLLEFVRQQQRYFPLYIRSAISLLPAIFFQYHRRKRPTWSEIKEMIYIETLRCVLERPMFNHSSVIVLDQGAIFLLAWLHLYGSEGTKSREFKQWANRATAQWAKTLDLVICLDAPDAVLIERIHNRQSEHRIKNQTQKEAQDFLARYRAVYEDIIAQLIRSDGPTVLRFDTRQISLEQIIDSLRTTLDEHNIYLRQTLESIL